MSSATPASGEHAAPTRIAAFFDLDKTIIAKSSMLAFSRPFFAGGLINRKAVLKSAYAQLVFALGGGDEAQIDRMRDYLTTLSSGWNAEQVRAIVAETLHEIVGPLVYAEAAELMADHRKKGHDVVIVSAAGEELVTPIAKMLGATYSIGTAMVIADGRFTGEIAFYCFGEQKAWAIIDLAGRRGYRLEDCFAYSDSRTDLPMLEAVGHPRVVNPDRALRRVAVERGWPVLSFSATTPLRGRLPSPTQTAVAATAVGIGAVAVGVTWYGLRRLRRG